MPVSPDFARGLAADLLKLYLDSEAILLDKVARRVAAGVDEPGWAERKLIEVQALRREAERVVADLANRMPGMADDAVRLAWNRGMAAAGADLGMSPLFGARDERAAAVLFRSLQERLAGTHNRIVRWSVDVYQRVTAETAGLVLTGTLTRREASAQALARYAARGVTGFVDRSGRSWDLASYVETATRTAAGNAAVQGHVETLRNNGHRLVQVSDAPEECELCRPWEGQVLALDLGSLGDHQGVLVTHTLDQATAAGLFHPNCRHRTGAFFPGVSEPLHDTADPAGDALRQQQRAYERRIRELKRRVVAAEGAGGKSSDAALRERAKLRAKQAEFKDWRERHGRKDLAYRTGSRGVPGPGPSNERPRPVPAPPRAPKPAASPPPQLEQVGPAPFDPTPFRQAKTAGEATAALRRAIAGRGTVNGYDPLFERHWDLERVRQVSETAAELFHRFPEVHADINFAQLSSSNVLAQAKAMIGPDKRLSGMALEINRSKLSKRSSFAEKWASDMAEGFYTARPDDKTLQPMRWVVRHEFGHLLDYTSANRHGGTRGRMNVRAAVNNEMASRGLAPSSEAGRAWLAANAGRYAQSSPAEMLAEAFADVETYGKNARALSVAVVRALMDWLGR